MESFHNKQYGNRLIGYTDDFKEFTKNHPGIIKELLPVLNNLHNNEHYINSDVEVELLPERPLAPGKKYFKIKVGSQSFFVKLIDMNIAEEMEKEGYGHTWDGGYREFASAKALETTINNLPGVEVVPAQLGYEDSAERIYVSRWVDLPRVEEYLSKHPEKRKSMEERLSLVRSYLTEYSDTGNHNIFYNEKKDSLMLFDIML